MKQFSAWLLCVLIVLLPGCAQLTEAQRSEINSLRREVDAARQEGEEAVAQFKRGELTEAQLAAIVARVQETAAKATTTIRGLEAQGVSPWQSLLETLGPAAAAYALAYAQTKSASKRTEAQAVEIAMRKVREERGDVNARKGLAPKGA